MERLDVQDQFISSIQSPNLHLLKNQCLHFNSSEPIADEEMDTILELSAHFEPFGLS